MLSCSYENTATVTIDTGIRKQAQLSLLDKLIAWISFSNALQADPPPNDNFNVLELRITAADMSPIVKRYTYTELYDNNGKITLEVPAGNQRLFTVIAGYLEAEEIYDKVYGGITTIDLSPGQNVNLNIEMGRLTTVYAYWNSNSQNVWIQYDKNYPLPIFFKVYQNIGITSPTYILIDTVAASSLSKQDYGEQITYFYSNSAINSGNFGQFWISAVNQYGEGNKEPINEN